MKKFLLPLLFLSVLCIDTKAQIELDTISSYPVGPGMVYSKIFVPNNPFYINVVEMDMKNPYLHFESNYHKLKTPFDQSRRETIKETVSKKDTLNHRVVATMAGTPFSYEGLLVSNEDIVESKTYLTESIAFNNAGSVDFYLPEYQSNVISGDSILKLSGINFIPSNHNYISLLNNHYDKSKITAGVKLLLKQLNKVKNNEVSYCIAEKFLDTVGLVDDNYYVLVGEGTGASFITSNINLNDAIKISTTITSSLNKVSELISGGTILIKDGNLTDFYNQNNSDPISLVCANADTSKIFFLFLDEVIIENKKHEVTSDKILSVINKFNITNAIELNSNWQSMMVRGEYVGLVDQGYQFKNSLTAISTAPDGILSNIILTKKTKRVFRGETYKFDVKGIDEYFNPIVIDTTKLKYTLSHDFGQISSYGLLTTYKIIDSGYVYVDYNGLKDSAYVIVEGPAKVVLTPKNRITDNKIKLNFSASAYDKYNNVLKTNLSEYTLKTDNPEIGVINSSGIFTGIKNGSVNVIATLNGVSDTSTVFVEIGDEPITIEPFEDLSGITFTGNYIDSLNSSVKLNKSIFTHGTSSLQIDFKYKANGNNWFYINLDKEIYGVPDTLEMDYKSDGLLNAILFVFTDLKGDKYRTITNYVTDTTFKTIKSGQVYYITNNVPILYPIKLNQIQIQLGKNGIRGQDYSGTLYFDELKSTYTKLLSSNADEKEILSSFKLEQNYPNPFNPSTTISYALPFDSNVKLTIYNLVGEVVAELINDVQSKGNHKLNFDANKLSSGVYFYMLNANSLNGKDNFSSTKKMILIK